MFPPDNVELLEKMFQLREISKIAEGTFGQVYKALDLTDNSICAVKVVVKSLCKDFSMEIEIIQSLQHEHIVQFKRVVENKHSYFLVMELMQGGTLSSRLNEYISDDLAASIMKKILKAVSYIHSNQIIHRDLKPDNILLLNENLDSCKIADFGLSFKFSQDGTFHRLLKSKCGTVLYMAPEQFSDKYYNKQIDSWSCGIIMYMLLSQGVHPLYDKQETKDQLIQKIKNPNWTFTDNFSTLARDFFKRMTAQSAIDRYSVDQALMHPWITRNFKDSIPLTYNEQINQFQRDQHINNRFKFVLLLAYIQKHSTSQTLMLDDSIDVDSEQSAKSQNSEQRARVPQLTVKKSLFSLKSQKNIRVTTPKFDFQLSQTKPRISSDNLSYIDDTIRPNTLRNSKSGGRITQYANMNNLQIYTNRIRNGLPPISHKTKK